MRCALALFTLAAVAALAGSPAAAAAGGERRISLQVKDLPLRAALAELTRQYGARFEVAPGIPDVPITLSAREEPLQDVIQRIVQGTRGRYMGAGAMLRDGVYQVRALPYEEQDGQAVVPEPPDPRLGRRVNLTLKGTPLRDALATLFEPAEGGYALEEPLGDLPIDLTTGETSAFQALLQVVDAARKQAPDLLFVRYVGIYFIQKARKAQDVLRGDPAAKRSVGVNRVPLRIAVEAVLAGTGFQFSIVPEATNVIVSLREREATPERSLQDLVRVAVREVPGLRLRRDGRNGGIYVLKTGADDGEIQ